MSTFIQLVTEVRDEIIEPTDPGSVTNVEIKRWLNEANRNLVNAMIYEAGVPEVAAPHTFDTVAGTEWYNMPANFGTPQLVERGSDDQLTWRSLMPSSLQLRQEETGIPLSYYMFSDNMMGLIPVPDAVYHMRVIYLKGPVDMAADADLPGIPALYHRLLSIYAAGQVFRKNQDPAFKTYINDFLAERAQMIRDMILKKQGNQGFRMVRDVG